MKRSGIFAVVCGVMVSGFVGCYASGQAPESPRAAFKNVEHGTGKVLEGTGNLIGAGVNAADKSWETKEEQRRQERRY